jgi:hypothetical protein
MIKIAFYFSFSNYSMSEQKYFFLFFYITVFVKAVCKCSICHQQKLSQETPFTQLSLNL